MRMNEVTIDPIPYVYPSPSLSTIFSPPIVTVESEGGIRPKRDMSSCDGQNPRCGILIPTLSMIGILEP